MKHPPTLATNRLILRPIQISESSRIQELAGHPDIYKTTLNIPHPYEEGMAEKWISTHSSEFYEGNGITLGIELKENKILIGTIGVSVNKKHLRGEIGYWIGVDFWGKGYCTEATIKAIEYGFTELKLHKIMGRHFESNPASGKVMKKAGMHKEGKHIDEFFKDGHFLTYISYGIINAST